MQNRVLPQNSGYSPASAASKSRPAQGVLEQRTLSIFDTRKVTLILTLVYALLTLLLGWTPWTIGSHPAYLFFVPLLTALIMAPLVGGRTA